MPHPVISKQATDLERLCRRYRVRRLALFGSAATGQDLAAAGDLDIVVEFEPLPPGVYANTYFVCWKLCNGYSTSRWTW